MDDIEDEFFANLSQATIDSAIEVWIFVLFVWFFEFFVWLQEGKSRIRVAPATTATTTTTTNVPGENGENSGNEKKEDGKTHSLDAGQEQEVVAMELCDSVQQVFAALPIVDLVCVVFAV